MSWAEEGTLNSGHEPATMREATRLLRIRLAARYILGLCANVWETLQQTLLSFAPQPGELAYRAELLEGDDTRLTVSGILEAAIPTNLQTIKRWDSRSTQKS